MGCKRVRFGGQKESFWKVKGVVLEGKRSPFGKKPYPLPLPRREGQGVGLYPPFLLLLRGRGWGFLYFSKKIVLFFFIIRNICTIFAKYNHKTQTKLRIYV